MGTERRSAAFYADATALDALPGPITTKWAVLEDTMRVFEWVPGDSTAADNVNVIAHTGGTSGRWLIRVGRVPVYAVADLPAAAAANTAALVYVSDEAGGATLAFSDGANWKRVQDLATVS